MIEAAVPQPGEPSPSRGHDSSAVPTYVRGPEAITMANPVQPTSSTLEPSAGAIQPFGSVVATLESLQAFQQYHDERFHKDVMSWTFDKQLEHCQMHLAKITGLLATVCEKKHHGEANEELAFVETRVADLLIFALKLANLYQIDLEAAYRDRLFRVEQKKLA